MKYMLSLPSRTITFTSEIIIINKQIWMHYVCPFDFIHHSSVTEFSFRHTQRAWWADERERVWEIASAIHYHWAYAFFVHYRLVSFGADILCVKQTDWCGMRIEQKKKTPHTNTHSQIKRIKYEEKNTLISQHLSIWTGLKLHTQSKGYFGLFCYLFVHNYARFIGKYGPFSTSLKSSKFGSIIFEHQDLDWILTSLF